LAEDVSALLFTLSSLDRLSLLRAIDLRKQRQITLSKLINASAQECSRHLTRLSDAGLITKKSDGLYETTPLGKSLLRLVPSIQFLATHKDFFVSHELTFLPHGFLERIGDLTDGTFVSHVSSVLEHIKSTISEAREFVWLISDQPIVTSLSLGEGFPSKAVQVRLISEPNLDLKGFSKARSLLPDQFRIATLGQVHVGMAISEKIAGVSFPGPKGQIDFGTGFAGTDARFRSWCGDLFEQYWSKSSKVMF
jgi:predicted transcriptional regulator